MYKVKQIADGMIIWHGDTVIGIKGMTLPDMFDDCDCYKVPGNSFDYSLSPHNEYTQEQKDYIDKAYLDWAEETDYVDVSDEPCNYDLPDDELPF